jgi:flagellar basal-body rod protein FlgG
MSDTIQIVSAAMHSDVENLRVISQNIANAETTAYRRQVAVNHLQFEQMLDGVNGQPPSLAAMQTQIAFDLQPGTLKSTAESLNVALDGPGFFVLQSNQGTVLTRRGDFHIATDGALVASNGSPVLGAKGTIQLGSGTPVIGADGSIKVGSDLVDQLRVVNVIDASRLVSLGDGTYRVDSSDVQEGDSHGAVRQGFLEASNVTPVNEMVQLMETVRRFEAEQKFVHAYDGMLDRAISELGKTS